LWTRRRINHVENQEPEYQAERQEDKRENMVRDEIENPDEKPQERGNGKEPAASAMDCPKFSPALDAKASEDISSGRATAAFFMISSYSFSLINSLKLAPRSRGPRRWDGESPAGHT